MRSEVVLRGAERDLHVLVAQLLQLVLEDHQRAGGLHRRAIGQLAGDGLAGDDDRLDGPGIGLVEEVGIADLGRGRAADLALEQAEQRKQQQRDDDPDGEIAELVHVFPRISPGPEVRHGRSIPRMNPNIGRRQVFSKDVNSVNVPLGRRKTQERHPCQFFRAGVDSGRADRRAGHRSGYSPRGPADHPPWRHGRARRRFDQKASVPDQAPASMIRIERSVRCGRPRGHPETLLAAAEHGAAQRAANRARSDPIRQPPQLVRFGPDSRHRHSATR